MRPSARRPNEARPLVIHPHYLKHAEGSVLIEAGETKVICSVSVTQGVPRFLKGQNQGWLTAEYGMLPRSTHERMIREVSKGRASGRTYEIQRLIGRSLRACLDLSACADLTLHIDCDVIQADGGTRTTSITGACCALYLACQTMLKRKMVQKDPFVQWINAISVGIYQGEAILDLDYKEDAQAETDFNIVMTEKGHFIELQGTAEEAPFSRSDLQAMLALAEPHLQEVLDYQKRVVTTL